MSWTSIWRARFRIGNYLKFSSHPSEICLVPDNMSPNIFEVKSQFPTVTFTLSFIHATHKRMKNRERKNEEMRRRSEKILRSFCECLVDSCDSTVIVDRLTNDTRSRSKDSQVPSLQVDNLHEDCQATNNEYALHRLRNLLVLLSTRLLSLHLQCEKFVDERLDEGCEFYFFFSVAILPIISAPVLNATSWWALTRSKSVGLQSDRPSSEIKSFPQLHACD